MSFRKMNNSELRVTEHTASLSFCVWYKRIFVPTEKRQITYVLRVSYPLWKSIAGWNQIKSQTVCLFNVGCRSFYSKTITITELFSVVSHFFLVNSVLIRLLANSKTVLSILSTFFSLWLFFSSSIEHWKCEESSRTQQHQIRMMRELKPLHPYLIVDFSPTSQFFPLHTRIFRAQTYA